MRRSLARIIQPSTRRFMSASAPPCKKINNSTTPATTTNTPNANSRRDSLILQKFKLRHLKGASSPVKKFTRSNEGGGSPLRPPPPPSPSPSPAATGSREVVSGFGELGLNEELVSACEEMGMVVPDEVQCVGIPEILKGSSLVMSSRSGYSRTLAYLLPLLQILIVDAASFCVERERPRAIVLCGSAEQCDKVFAIAKFINEHARQNSAGRSSNFRNGGDKECSSGAMIGMLVGTPEEILRQIEEGDVAVADMRYLVVDEADILLDSPCFTTILEKLSQLKTIKESSNRQFQTVLVTSSISDVLEKHLVAPLERDRSGEVAAVILEIGPDEVIQLMETPGALKKKFSEAVKCFNTSTSGS